MEYQTYAPAPMPPAPARRPGKGLAITALILGIVALVLCWVPVLNNVFLFVGIAGLGFAIAALVVASKHKAPKGMAVAGLILSVLSIIGVFASQALYVAAIDSVVAEIEDGADGVVEAPAEEEQAAAGELLPLGSSAEIGEYTVTVTNVNLDAAEQMLAANPYNAAPAGQYVLVDMAVVYNGSEEGDPWIDLTTELAGADSRIYSTTTCNAVTERPAFEVPTLTTSGTGEYSLCFDVPAEAVTEATVQVEETLSFTDTAAAWATR